MNGTPNSRCDDVGMAGQVVAKDSARKLTCNISGGGGSDVKVLTGDTITA
jgi:hypothetical protein